MSAIPTPPVRATFDDLMREPGRAELIGGRIERFPMTGAKPGIVAVRIFGSLDAFAASAGHGNAYPADVGFRVPELLSGRESFGPDAAFYAPPVPEDHMGFVDGAPTFAVEVRSQNDYGPAKDREYEAKRRDYFEAGTLVVWDVDPVAKTIASYSASDPTAPRSFGPGETADAEPAVPGWSVAVDSVMRG